MSTYEEIKKYRELKDVTVENIENIRNQGYKYPPHFYVDLARQGKHKELLSIINNETSKTLIVSLMFISCITDDIDIFRDIAPYRGNFLLSNFAHSAKKHDAKKIQLFINDSQELFNMRDP
jgi:hypothetical protein